MKDMLYQAYVRRGRLQQALMVRRHFAEDPPGPQLEDEEDQAPRKVAPLGTARF